MADEVESGIGDGLLKIGATDVGRQEGKALADQLNRLQTPRGVLPPPRRKPVTDAGPLANPPPVAPVAALATLQFFNGLGGFSQARTIRTPCTSGRTTTLRVIGLGRRPRTCPWLTTKPAVIK